MEMAEANQRRDAVLTPLMQELERRKPPGLAWKRSSQYSGCPFVWVSAVGKSERAVIQAVWYDPEWILKYRPWPSTDDAFYEVTITKTQDYGSGHPEQTHHLVSADVEEVIGTLTSWREAIMPAAMPRTSRPLDENELAPLKALARAIQDSPEAALVIEEDLRRELGEDGCRALATSRIARNYPREADGRLPLGEIVPLTPFGQPEPTGLKRSLWVAALSPLRRRESQVVTLGLRWLIAANHAHRWDAAPWLWNGHTPRPTEQERWGVSGLPLSRLGLSGRDAQIGELQREATSEGGRAALCLLRQDAGRFGEAFALFGVEADEDVWGVLNGQAPYPSYEDRADVWADVMRLAFQRCAPWRLRGALAAANAGRRPAARRLFALPGQAQARKVSLLLTADGDVPRFILDGTASNARLPVTLWQRPLELDLRRFGFWKDTDADG